MGRLLRYMWRLNRLSVAFSLVASTVAGVLIAVVPLLTGSLVGGLANPRRADLTSALWLVVAIGVCLAAIAVAPMVLQTLSTRISDEIVEDTTRRLSAAVSSARSLALLEDPATATMRRRIRARQWEVKGGGRQLIGPAAQTIIAAIFGTAALVATAGGLVAACIVAGLVLHVVWATIASRRELDLVGQNVEEQKQAEYAFSIALDEAAKELRVFELGDFLGRRYWDLFTRGITPYWRGRTQTALLSLVPVIIRGGLCLVALIYVGHRAASGGIGVGSFAAAVPLVLSLSSLSERSFDTVFRGGVVLGWLEDFERAMSARRPAAPIPASEELAASVGRRSTERPGFAGRVEVDGVSFSYPGSDRRVLDGVSFVLTPGEPVALVGVNGAGKSTLVKLLCGAYMPTGGMIRVDGRDLRDLDREELIEWQRSIGLVGQEFLRLPLTIADNVEIGAGGLVASDGGISASQLRHLDHAAERATLDDLVGGLPEGWMTPLDRSQPGGTDLSGGEWQRVALARIVRGVQAGRISVALLDEPAAALDVDAEARLVDEYLSWVQNISSLIISHRFSVVRPVGRILVLDHGRITEDGSHDELINLGGTYRRLFDLQAQQFLTDRSGVRR